MAYKELTLDTKGSCFLCLTRASTPSQTDTDDGTTEACHLTVQSLGNICRLLKINPYSVLIKSIGHDDHRGDISKAAVSFGEFLVNSEGENTKCDFSASLCETCYPVANKLASLSHELEMIIMMTRDQLQKFHGILSVTPTVSPANEQDPTTKTSQLTGNAEMETKLIENLREEIEHKSHSYLNRRPSMESPNKCHTNFDTVTHPHHDPNTIEEYRKRVRTPSSENSSEYHHPHQKNSHLTKKLRRNTPSPSLSTDKASPASTESVDTQINLGGPQDDHEDPPSLDLAHYKCLRIGDRCQCPFCGNLFSDSVSMEDGIDYHLVVNHLHKIYPSKNVTNLSSPSFQQLCQQVIQQVVRPALMQPQDSSKSATYIYSCSECSKHYKTHNWATFHFILDHFKTFEDKLIYAQHDNPQQLVFNQQTIQFQNSAPKVSKMEHQKNFPVYPSSTTNSIPPVNNLFQDLINIPSDESSSNSTHSQRSDYPPPTPTTTPAPQDSAECHGKIVGEKIQCTFCKAMFGAGKSSSSAIRLHVACFHPEKLFSASKLPEINESIFFELCRDVIKNELRAAQLNSVGGGGEDGKNLNVLLCSNCNKTFTRMHNLKYHCVNSHFEIMADKLVQLQEDYLQDKSSALAMQPKPSPLQQPISTSTSLEQHQWQILNTEEQSKSNETNIPTTAYAAQDSIQFPNFRFNSTSVGDGETMQMETGSHSSTTSANPTSITNDMIWSKSSMSAVAPPPAHQIKTEGLYYQYPAPTTISDSQQIYNSNWLPPPQSQLQSQNYYHANPQPSPSSSQYQLLSQNYYDMAINQLNQGEHGPSPTWLRLPTYPEAEEDDEQNYHHNQMEIVKEGEKTSNNFQNNSVSPLPPIGQYLRNVGGSFIESAELNEDQDINVDKTDN